jgi:hypothetical protein
VKARQAKVFMDIKIWIQAYKTNGITGAGGWADIKDNHRRTPDLANGQKNTSKIALSLDTTSYTLQGQNVRQRFRIRWKKDRRGPDRVLYGYDGFTDSCNLPLEGGAYGGLGLGGG